MKDTREVKLEALKVVILDHGEKVKVIELPDPRDRYLADFNAFWADVGMTAEVA